MAVAVVDLVADSDVLGLRKFSAIELVIARLLEAFSPPVPIAAVEGGLSLGQLTRFEGLLYPGTVFTPDCSRAFLLLILALRDFFLTAGGAVEVVG